MTDAVRVLLAAGALVLAGCISGNGTDATDDGNGPGGDDGTNGVLAAFTVEPTADPATFAFDAGPSKGKDLSYAWEFGDGETGTGEEVQHAYTLGDATLAVTLAVTDSAGTSDSTVQGVSLGSGLNKPPVPTVQVSSDWVATGRPFTAGAAATDPDGDAVTVRLGYARLGPTAPAYLVPSTGGDEHHHGDGAAYAPADNGFDSPVINATQTYANALDAPGVYFYHCHPHPTMTGTVIVADDPAATGGTLSLSAWRISTFLPNTVMVKPGTRLVWDNPDPVWHSVTLSTYVPVQRFVTLSAGQASLTFEPEGVYAVVAVATDAKGATGFTHTLVKATRNVPARVIDLNWTGEVPAPASDPGMHEVTLEYPGTASIGFTWTAQTPAEVSQVRLDVFQGDTTGTPVTTSSGEPITVRLAPGTYVFRVTNEQALLVTYEIRFHADIEVTPDFGAAPAGDGHDHGH